ncbi:hypothetical protein CPB85DRAFT_571667 [Mucidula mucida]|nr:hypothetical protein CPB85DRAFT_571667 [Mucidula mucida]
MRRDTHSPSAPIALHASKAQYSSATLAFSERLERHSPTLTQPYSRCSSVPSRQPHRRVYSFTHALKRVDYEDQQMVIPSCGRVTRLLWRSPAGHLLMITSAFIYLRRWLRPWSTTRRSPCSLGRRVECACDLIPRGDAGRNAIEEERRCRGAEVICQV